MSACDVFKQHSALHCLINVNLNVLSYQVQLPFHLRQNAPTLEVKLYVSNHVCVCVSVEYIGFWLSLFHLHNALVSDLFISIGIAYTHTHGTIGYMPQNDWVKS